VEALHSESKAPLPAPTSIRSVLFDIDGTLVASNDAQARSWVGALHEYGLFVRFGQVRKLIGMGADKLVPGATGQSAAPETIERVSARRAELFRRHELPRLHALPGARVLLERLLARGTSVGVASSAPPSEASLLLERLGLRDLLEPAPVPRAVPSKPDPDVIEAALQHLRCPPGEAILVGDTPYDIEAGRRAGVATVAFRSGGWPDVQLKGALALYDGPQDLLDKLGRPPFDSRGLVSPAPWN